MDQRAAYLLQILETIGSPLMSAITQSVPVDATDEAQSMAALLGKTVEASIELGNIMEINPAEAQDDTLRVALAGLAGPLVAGQFAKRGSVPEAPDLKKITGSLQAVLTFSDNFTPTPETVERLRNLEASGQIVDTYQTQIQYMQAFIPVVEAVSAFPFGQAEAKLIMEVSERLVKKSVELREALLPDIGDEATQKRAELGLLKALAEVYSACHKAETAKAMSAGMDAQDSVSIESVYNAFDMRAAMMEALAAKMVPGAGGGSASKAPAPVAAAEPPAAPVEPPTPAAPPPAEQAPPPVSPEAPAAAPATPPPAGVNPMAMFAKPKSEGDTGSATPPPAETPTPPPAQEQAPTPQTPAQPPAEQPPPQTPPAAPPAESSGEDSDGDSGNAGGNPMSFFKKKDDE